MDHDRPGGDRYPGARPFQDDDLDRKLFRGRETEAQALLHLVLAEPWVLLYGRSGVGKSSLLNAGVMAELRRERHLPLRVRLNDPAAGPRRAFIASLEESARLAGIEYLPGDASSLPRFFETAELWAEDTLLTPVVILDQFEELFTLHSPEQRQEFVDELAPLLRATGGRALKLVCSVREDFLGDLEDLAPKIPGILSTRFRLTSMSRSAAARAIEEPAALEDAGLRTTPFAYGPGVVEAILDFLGERKEAAEPVRRREIEPFQLQILCRHAESVARARQEAGETRVVLDQAALGGEVGLRQVLERFYEDEIAGIAGPTRHPALFRLCEQGLISPRGRRLSLEEGDIETRFGVPPAVLTRLVERRILRADPRVGSVYYELSHDSLIGPILASRDRRSLSRRKHRKRISHAVQAALLVGLAGYYYWQFSGPDGITVSPETTRITLPLGPSGLPDYAAAFNARYGAGVTPASNAAVDLLATVSTSNGEISDDLRAALGVPAAAPEGKLRFVGGLGEAAPVRELVPARLRDSFSEARFTDELTRATAEPWSDEECPMVAAWLTANERALDAVRQATHKPYFWIPALPRRSLAERPIPHAPRLRNVARALRARALRRMRQGEPLAAAEELYTMQRLGTLVSRGPSALEKFFGSVLAAEAAGGFAILSASAGLASGEAQAMLAGLESLPRPDDDYAEAIGVAERWGALDAVVRAYEWRRGRPRFWRGPAVVTDPAAGAIPENRPDLYSVLPAWAAIDWDRVLREVNRDYDGHVRALLASDEERERLLAARPSPDVDVWSLVWRLILSPREGFTRMTRTMMASLRAVPDGRRAEPQAMQELASLALGVASYRAGHGGFPRMPVQDTGFAPAGGPVHDERRLFQVVYRPLQPSGGLFRSFALVAEGSRGVERFRAACLGPTGRIVRYENARVPGTGDGRCPDAGGDTTTAAVPDDRTAWRVWWSDYSLFQAFWLTVGAAVLWRLSRVKVPRRRPAMATVAAGMAIILLWPFGAYRRFRVAQDELKGQVEQATRAVGAAATGAGVKGSQELRETSARARQQELERRLPTRIDEAGFIARFEELARASGVALAGTRYEPEAREASQRHDEGRLWLTLRASPGGLEALRTRRRDLEASVRWREERKTPSGLETSVQLFALPEIQYPSACQAAGHGLYPKEVDGPLSRCCVGRWQRRDLAAACGRLIDSAQAALPLQALENDVKERQAFLEKQRF